VPDESLLNASVPCELCGNVRVEMAGTQDRDGQPLRVVLCPACGLVWNDPRPGPGELIDYYREEYRRDYKNTVEPRPRHTVRAARVAGLRCAALVPSLDWDDEVLDLGAGGGEVVYVLRRLGFRARGIEPNEGYARFARERLGVPVESGTWQDAGLAGASVDAVTLFHVLEHLDGPLEALRLIRHWLRPGGLLWIEVPNIESVCQAPAHRFHRAHLYSFNTVTLAGLARRAGFEVERTFTSDDAGNITAVLHRSETLAPGPFAQPGNADRIRRILRGHTCWSHLVTAAPYVRPFRRLAQRLAELRSIRGETDPKVLIARAVESDPGAGQLHRAGF